MTPYLNDMLSVLLSAYRQQHSCQHVLLHLIEMWRKCLDDNMDLSTAFDCLARDLLIAKLDAYGFDNSAWKLIASYLTGRKHCVKSNDILSLFKEILSGVPQGSILDLSYSINS